MKVIIATNSETLIAAIRPRIVNCGLMIAGISTNSYELLRMSKALAPTLIIIDDELEGGNLIPVVESLTFDRHAVILLGKSYQHAYYQPSPYLEFSNKPVQLSLLEATIRLLVKYTDSLRLLESKVEHYEQKQKTDQQVRLAKRLLQQQKQMSEEDAHRYIQKTSMEQRISKLECAEKIIQQFGKQ